MASYNISKPTAYPESAPPGPVLITVPITSLVDYYTEVTVKVRVFEGSGIWPTPGDVMDTLVEYNVGLYPGEKTDVKFMHSSELTSQSRRDIEVSIWQGDTKFEQGNWNDIFYVTEPEEAPPEEPETLEVDITGGYGYVTTDPASIEGYSIWYDNDTGTFPYGTEVLVTAYPNSGYEFEKWSDEIEGGVSYDNPAYVKPMTEHRAVKCHFRVIEEEPVWPLEIDITPSAGGIVRTSLASIEGREEWHDGNIGTFEEGTIVQVTAIPNDGYEFEKWTDEIQGGTSYNNPASVKPMTEHRAVKCHFKEITEPPPEEPPPEEPPPEEPPPEEEPSPEAKKIPWGPILIGTGATVVLAAALSKKKASP